MHPGPIGRGMSSLQSNIFCLDCFSTEPDSFREVFGTRSLLLPSPGRVLWCGVQRIIGSGVSSQPLTGIPRCLPRTPSSSPTKERRRSAGLATLKEQGTSATLNTRSLGLFNQSMQMRIAQLSADNKTWSNIYPVCLMSIGGQSLRL